VPASGNLERWAKQGVLLLNATLTVEQSKPGSHQGLGWETFTDAVIKTISDQKEHVIFLLWGNFARSKAALIDRSKHLVLEAPHPSPFSAHSGFFGCKHFSKTNKYLTEHDLLEISW
jgi:uracil-DNA glycosylase